MQLFLKVNNYFGVRIMLGGKNYAGGKTMLGGKNLCQKNVPKKAEE